MSLEYLEMEQVKRFVLNQTVILELVQINQMEVGFVLVDNQKKINLSIAIILIAGFTYLGLTDDNGLPLKNPTHYCESRGEKAYCFELRNYSDSLNYRCLYDEDNLRRYFSCKEGWVQIPSITSKGSKGEWSCPSRPQKFELI